MESMNENVLISPFRPRLFSPDRPTLDPGVERYVLKGGGTSALELERGDRLELGSLEGGQQIEVVVFAPGGKSDLGALGLTGRQDPVGIKTALGTDSEDAARVRFGLFRRGLDLG